MASLIAFGVALQLLAMPAQTAGPAEVTEAAKRWHLLTAEAARKFGWFSSADLIRVSSPTSRNLKRSWRRRARA